MNRDLLLDARLAWEELERSKTRGGELDSIPLDGGRIIVARDSDGIRHLLLPVSSNARVGIDERSAGIRISPRTLIDDGDPRRFVDVACLKPHLFDIFLRYVAEVGERLAASTSVYRTCVEVADLFREFVRSVPDERLSDERMLGLMGELLLLRDILEIDADAHGAWLGPAGARHDFAVGSIAIEVKTTGRRKSRTFEISSLDQLEPPPGSDLYLETIRLEKIPSGELTLHGLVEDVMDRTSGCNEVRAKLEAAGYRDDGPMRRDETRYRLIDRYIYHVDEVFPSLTPSKMKDGRIPPGVLEASYTITLDMEPPVPLTDDQRALVLKRLTGVVS